MPVVKYGFILFDDYLWKCSAHSKDTVDGISTRSMSSDQLNTPNIDLVFQLLVMQHPNFGNFVRMVFGHRHRDAARSKKH